MVATIYGRIANPPLIGTHILWNETHYMRIPTPDIFRSSSLKPWGMFHCIHDSSNTRSLLTHFGFHIKTLTWNHTKFLEIRFLYEYWIFKCKLIFLFCVDTVRYHTFQGKFFKPFLKEKYFCFCLCRGGMKTIMICKTFQSLLYFPKYWVDLEDF